MPNIYGAPEIDVQEVADKRKRGEEFIWLDVREQMELRLANLGQDVLWIPLSDLAARRETALTEEFEEKEATIVVHWCTQRSSYGLAAAARLAEHL
jgi:rhodanese-related sulfurtransferase